RRGSRLRRGLRGGQGFFGGLKFLRRRRRTHHPYAAADKDRNHARGGQTNRYTHHTTRNRWNRAPSRGTSPWGLNESWKASVKDGAVSRSDTAQRVGWAKALLRRAHHFISA